MIRYQIRSRDLVGIYNEIQAHRLIPDAYFQRNLVWRESHNQDFIKTILLGYPFPQIFISKGKINIETMQTTSCIVDGQQRLNAITEFIEDKFRVDGRTFSDLSNDEKSDFLKYEIAVIELDIENTDSRVKEIFQRINRTSNALTQIEKLASEYAASDFMFTCRILSDDIDVESDDEDFRIDPVITSDLVAWARNLNISKFRKLIFEEGVFSQHELTRKVHLQYVLNIVATILIGIYNRNDKVTDLLNDYSQNFPGKDDLILQLEETAEIYLKLKLPMKSVWKRKANFFSLFVEMAVNLPAIKEMDLNVIKDALLAFGESLPVDYKLAAQEAVNNAGPRELRSRYIKQILGLI